MNKQQISIDDFKKLEIKIGTILSAEPIEGSEKLLKLEVDFGSSEKDSLEREIRQILAGIAKWYSPEDLIGKQCPFLVNLEPRKMMDMESQGMLLAVNVDNKAVLLHPDKVVPSGSETK